MLKMASPSPLLFDEIQTFLKYLVVVLILLLTSYFCIKSHSNILIVLSESLAACEVSPPTCPLWFDRCISYRTAWAWMQCLGAGVRSPCPSRCHPALRSFVAWRSEQGRVVPSCCGCYPPLGGWKGLISFSVEVAWLVVSLQKIGKEYRNPFDKGYKDCLCISLLPPLVLFSSLF